MTKEDKELIEKITKMTSMTSREVGDLERMIRKYIDPNCFICRTCSAQVRFSWIRLCEWWKLQNQSQWRFIKQK
jgi:hypothetical protein